jgi:hypothetical protein
MSTKKSFTLLLSLLLVGVLLGLSGCGNQVAGQTPGEKPDNLQIEIDELPLHKTVLNLKDAGLTQQIYALIYALPQMPDNIGCTAEGTTKSYKLTFRQGDKTLGIVDPTDTGCLPVSIKGESHDRQGTKALWSLLYKAVYVATPQAKPVRLAILRTSTTNRQPKIAQITTVSTVQRLYNAILALPLGPLKNDIPAYQLVFHTSNQDILSIIDETGNAISLEGNNQTRGGWYIMNDQFKRLLQETLSGTTFAPALPDQLSFTLSTDTVNRPATIITNVTSIQKLYKKILSLPVAQSQHLPDCLGNDKISGKGKWYYLNFFQWGMPILQIQSYEGCSTVFANVINNQLLLLQDNQELWALVHNVTLQR